MCWRCLKKICDWCGGDVVVESGFWWGRNCGGGGEIKRMVVSEWLFLEE